MTFAKRRFRIICTVIAMVLVTIMMSVGIYAASKVSINNTGIITFTAKDVCADVKVYKLHNKDASSINGTTEAYEARTYGVSTATGEDSYVDTQTLDFSNCTFTKATDYFVLVFSVQNTFAEGTNAGVSVTVSDVKIAPTQYQSDIKVEKTFSGMTDGKIAPQATGTVSIKISLSEALQASGTTDNISFSFTVNIDRSEIVATA